MIFAADASGVSMLLSWGSQVLAVFPIIVGASFSCLELVFEIFFATFFFTSPSASSRDT